jgi:hypothetical protein
VKQEPSSCNILRKAQDLIRDPRHWIGGDLSEKRAIDPAYEACIVSTLLPDGRYAPAEVGNADCFCAGLAITRACRDLGVYSGPTRDLAVRAMNEAAIDRSQTGISQLGQWNDNRTRTHDEVMAAFDAAISRASA